MNPPFVSGSVVGHIIPTGRGEVTNSLIKIKHIFSSTNHYIRINGCIHVYKIFLHKCNSSKTVLSFILTVLSV